MTKAIPILALIILGCAAVPTEAAQPSYRTLQAQYGVPAGFAAGDGAAACITGYIYVECVTVPAGSAIVAYVGTITVKSPGVELLLQVICDNLGGGEAILYQAEYRTVNTWNIVSPPNFPAFEGGDCYLQWQTISPYATPNGWEIQLTLFSQ